MAAVPCRWRTWPLANGSRAADEQKLRGCINMVWCWGVRSLRRILTVALNISKRLYVVVRRNIRVTALARSSSGMPSKNTIGRRSYCRARLLRKPTLRRFARGLSCRSRNSRYISYHSVRLAPAHPSPERCGVCAYSSSSSALAVLVSLPDGTMRWIGTRQHGVGTQ